MEQKILSLCGEATVGSDEKPAVLSPSTILLNGYTPASVDQDTKETIGKELDELRRRLADVPDEEFDPQVGSESGGTGDQGTGASLESNISEMERITNSSVGSEYTASSECGRRGKRPCRSDSSSEYGTSDRRDEPKLDRLDLEDLPGDVVDVIREALKGVNSNGINNENEGGN